MNNTFSLTLPTNDPIALNAFSRALREMAVAHGAPIHSSEIETSLSDIPLMEEYDITQEEIDAISEVTQEDALANYQRDHVTVVDTTVTPPVIVSGPEDIGLKDLGLIDSEGLPWDERIHSGAKSRNKDGTWKARRNLSMEPEAWSQYVQDVKDELHDLMSVPVVTPPEPELAAAIEAEQVVVTPPPVAEPEEPAVVTPPPVVVEPPPVVAPPVSVAPPVVVDNVTTFPLLMSWITARGDKLNVTTVTEVVQRQGLTELKQLIQRPDLIPQVFNALNEELNK